jgi:hypothetical protein
MDMSREKDRASSATGRSIVGASLPWVIASMALAKTVPFAGGQFKVANGNLSPTASVAHENVSLRSLTMGQRTIRLDDGWQRAPIQVRVTRIDANGQESAPIDSGESAPLALTPDIQRPAGMSALDAFSSFDLGRMLRGDASQTTRIQVFLAMQEHDDDAFADDTMPELVVFGGTNGQTLRVTPILDGSPDVPATLAFGQTHEIAAEAFSKGRLPVEIGFVGDDRAQTIGAVGLDLSGDLGVGPGKSVVGYQIELPAGSETPVKVLASGEIEFGAYANFADVAPTLAKAALGQLGSDNAALDAADDATTRIIGPVLIGSGKSSTTDAPALPESVYTPPETRGFEATGSRSVPPTTPTTTAVPAPGVLGLFGCTLWMGRRRRTA